MAETTIGIKGKFLEYKGKPLVRQDDELYYGNMSDKFILFLMIMNYKEDAKLHAKVPGKVMVQIIPTDGSQKIEKQGMADGLYEALDLGSAWLERANRV
ncbi:MAG: hypothetical protein IJY20_03270 [Clostridia bacterium]|nr:hypothetical protein [Clostridia bacterium]